MAKKINHMGAQRIERVTFFYLFNCAMLKINMIYNLLYHLILITISRSSATVGCAVAMFDY